MAKGLLCNSICQMCVVNAFIDFSDTKKRLCAEQPSCKFCYSEKLSKTPWPVTQTCRVEHASTRAWTVSRWKSSVESQKGAITIQRCSVENKKGAVAIDFVQ